MKSTWSDIKMDTSNNEWWIGNGILKASDNELSESWRVANFKNWTNEYARSHCFTTLIQDITVELKLWTTGEMCGLNLPQSLYCFLIRPFHWCFMFGWIESWRKKNRKEYRMNNPKKKRKKRKKIMLQWDQRSKRERWLESNEKRRTPLKITSNNI